MALKLSAGHPQDCLAKSDKLLSLATLRKHQINFDVDKGAHQKNKQMLKSSGRRREVRGRRAAAQGDCGKQGVAGGSSRAAAGRMGDGSSGG
ncbi:hypothetical protein SAY87_011544 [Trapa incisa]|uniref:Uncharacterized protein n=1 Tax=Trapa incisa TaxID=236973 RepID=A0AAN7GS36_9MYRT|nr:hypothetical protein SAY87_011544 [Trapa incisa]